MRDWIFGNHEWQSIAFRTDGTVYNIPKDIVFSFPCTTANGRYVPVHGLNMDDAMTAAKIAITTEELIAERQAIEHLL